MRTGEVGHAKEHGTVEWLIVPLAPGCHTNVVRAREVGRLKPSGASPLTLLRQASAWSSAATRHSARSAA